MTLDALGWSRQRRNDFAPHAAEGLLPGRVVGEHRSPIGSPPKRPNSRADHRPQPQYGHSAIRPAGCRRLRSGTSCHGRWPGHHRGVLPRTSALVRKAAGERRPQLLAANIDVVFIVTAPDRDFNLPRLERYLALVQESGAAPVIVVNKSDLTNDVIGITGQIAAIAPGVPIHAISARGGDNLSDLERYFDGNRTIVLVGSSGVGKSTLTNELLGRAAQATQEVRAHDSRGRHTTTHRQLFTRPKGGAIIDTPGIRGWNSGMPRKAWRAISRISKPWPHSVGFAIAGMKVSRDARCALSSSGDISMRRAP